MHAFSQPSKPATVPPASAQMLARLRAQCDTQRSDWQDLTTPEALIPVQRYTSEAQRQAEVTALFRPLPLIAAHSSQIGLGQALAHDAFDMPIVITRDGSGQVRAHLNVCRHRGTRLLVASSQAQNKASLVCPYHGWTYQLDGRLRHRLHAESFDAKPCEQDNLVSIPCAEQHGLIWIIPQPSGDASPPVIDLAQFLGGLNDELPFYAIDQLVHFRTIEAEYPANWKLIVDAFLESYHIRVLHQKTIYPFFTDGITASAQFGAHQEHIHSLVARRAALQWAQDQQADPVSLAHLCSITTPSSVIFPNTIAIWHPDYLSLISLYPTAAGRHRWTHRMLIPKDKAGADWTPHWEKTFQLIEQGVFQAEDIATAVSIQQGFASNANSHLRLGRIETGLAWFHASVQSALARHLVA